MTQVEESQLLPWVVAYVWKKYNQQTKTTYFSKGGQDLLKEITFRLGALPLPFKCEEVSEVVLQGMKQSAEASG